MTPKKCDMNKCERKASGKIKRGKEAFDVCETCGEMLEAMPRIPVVLKGHLR